MRSEAAFVHLCGGVAPIHASSGKTNRHRLNRGGDRGANIALYTVALSRMRCDQRTRDHLDRRTTEGLTRPEIIRCLKRYLAREIYLVMVIASRPFVPAHPRTIHPDKDPTRLPAVDRT
jgi:transposase